MAATSSRWRKQETNGQDLIDVVFSWSIDEVLNQDLYKAKVKKIPDTFSSTTCYMKSFIDPLLEETHADLLSKMSSISFAPKREIISVSKAQDFKFSRGHYFCLSLKNKSGNENNYEPELGDLIALTSLKPKSIDDLATSNENPYLIALVQRLNYPGLSKIQIYSSKPIVFPRMLETNNGRRMVQGGKFYAIHLTNLTTNIRIWRALNSRLEGNNLKILKQVLQTGSNDGEKCPICINEDPKKSFSLTIKQVNTTLDLNESQETAVQSCIAASECHHRETVKLIWGPPGTGKTKTIGSMLFVLWRLKRRTLTCAPTNNAVLEVLARLISIAKSVHEFDTYGSGDIVLFGKGERMMINSSFQELNQVFLENRISILATCLSPTCGWRTKAESLIRLLKHPKKEYDSYLEKGKREFRDIEDYDQDDEEEEFELVDCVLDVKDKFGNNIVWKEKVFKLPKKDSESNVIFWTFEEFIIKRFNVLEEKLKKMVKNLYTHMPTSLLTPQVAEKMTTVISLLQKTGTLIRKITFESNDGLREIMKGIETSEQKMKIFADFHKIKTEFCHVLHDVLCKTRLFPQITENQEIENFCLENACLIFCTASSSIRLHTLEKNFELLIVDEASQLRECESLIPLQLSGLRHAILVGDEKQIPAMVQSQICENAKFGRSLFERLVWLNYPTNLLNTQYRMHPMISSFPNKEFYGDKILNGPNVKGRSYNNHFLQGENLGHYSFIHLANGKVERNQTKSRINMVEVAVIAELIAKLHEECSAKKQKISVGCITPYKAQACAIKEKLGDRCSKKSEGEVRVKVETVDGFQGCEEDVIIISTVTGVGNGSVGFLKTSQRANVALTRARYCLWILGNGETLINGGGVWERLVEDAKARRCFYVANHDITLAPVITKTLVELGQFDGLLDMNSLVFKGSKWKVCFSDKFSKSIANLKSPETYKKVCCLLTKLSKGWRMRRKDAPNPELFEIYSVKYKGLRVAWSVDVITDNTKSFQVLKIWDILQGSPVQLVKLIQKFYGKYSKETLDRCKEKCVKGNVELPVIWKLELSSKR